MQGTKIIITHMNHTDSSRNTKVMKIARLSLLVLVFILNGQVHAQNRFFDSIDSASYQICIANIFRYLDNTDGGIPSLPNKKPKCGHWEPKEIIGEWEVVDTIGTYKYALYVELKMDEWVHPFSFMTKAVYCPCGCPEPITAHQYAVDVISGVRYIRYKTKTYTYIDPEPTEYEKSIEYLQKR